MLIHVGVTFRGTPQKKVPLKATTKEEATQKAKRRHTQIDTNLVDVGRGSNILKFYQLSGFGFPTLNHNQQKCFKKTNKCKSIPPETYQTHPNSVAFCSPAKSLTFSALMENPSAGKKLKSQHPLAKCTKAKSHPD